MDLFLPIVLFIVFCVLFSICGWCCKKHREGHVYGHAPNVTVTTQPASTIVSPYPVDPSYAQAAAPGPGFAHTGGYQAAPYPVPAPYPQPPGTGYPPATPYPVTVAAPYPPATPSYQSAGAAPYPPAGGAPYPPASGAPYPTQQQPPSYMEAVGQPPAEPRSVNEGYSKQAPYNPNY